jgi:hypothetical protein
MGAMAYSDFTLEDVKQKLGITLREAPELFAGIPPQTPSAWLVDHLRETVPLALAISTEKARSEFIVAPILLEVRRLGQGAISLFSGTEFNVDEAKGLSGFCDWILGRSPEQLTVEAPVVAIVEAKNENIRRGIAQCLAELVAAQEFNARRGSVKRVLHGAVTTGDLWRFMRLSAGVAEVDLSQFHVQGLDRLLGVLLSMTAEG